MVIHVGERDVFACQAKIAPLQRDEVIPHDRRDKDHVPQFPIWLIATVQAIFVHLVNRDRLAHALTFRLSESVWELTLRDRLLL